MHRFDERRLQSAWQLAKRWVDQDECTAVAAAVGDGSGVVARAQFGRQRNDSAEPLDAEPIFLIASPTKPVTALAVMMLVESGQVKLHDPVSRYLASFAGGGKRRITIAHCLTHTSGLPDMLPDNLDLRRRQAPLDEFFASACQAPLAFKPGHGVQYQSTGLLAAARVLEHVVGQRLPDFLLERVFAPLGMNDTALGMTDDWTQATGNAKTRAARIVESRAPEELSDPAWGWNSDYWRRLGAPWGGLLASAADWGRLCTHLLAIHRGEPGIVSTATLQAMTSNQLAMMPDVPESNRRCRPWGLGWQLNWPGDPVESLGDLLSPRAYGHWGMTGTQIWLDPERALFGVVLTNQPLELGPRRQSNLTNALCGAWRPN